jgi:hypothetical protein
VHPTWPVDVVRLAWVYSEEIARGRSGQGFGFQRDDYEQLLEAVRVFARDAQGPFPAEEREPWLRFEVAQFVEHLRAVARTPEGRFWRPNPKSFLRWLNERQVAHAEAEESGRVADAPSGTLEALTAGIGRQVG